MGFKMRNRIIGLLAAVLAVSLAGCGEVEETGYLSLSQASGIALEEEGCGAPDKTLVPPLMYDAGVGARGGYDYMLGLWFQNNLVANDDTDGTSTGRTNTNRVQVERVVVEFPDRDRWPFLPESIDVGMPFVVDTESEIGWPTRLIPVRYAREMIENSTSPIVQAGDRIEPLRIRIRASGQLLDGTKVESNTFDMELGICNDCISDCPEGSDPDDICVCPIGTEAKGCSRPSATSSPARTPRRRPPPSSRPGPAAPALRCLTPNPGAL